MSPVSGGVALVDLDDTLVPDKAATELAVAQVLYECGLRSGDEAVTGLLASARACWRSGPFHETCLAVGISSWEGLWLVDPSRPREFAEWVYGYQYQVWDDAGADDPEAAQHRYHTVRAGFCTAFADVAAGLDALGGRYRLWLATNGESGHQRRKVGLAGLDRWFERLVVSGDLGVAKPADGFFSWVQCAAGRAGHAVELVVGDSIEGDIRPAVARGWPAVLVRRDTSAGPAPTGLDGVRVVGSLVELGGSGGGR